MDTAMVITAITTKLTLVKATLKRHKKMFWLVSTIVLLILISLQPRAFVDLWLTKDQQGQLLFTHGHFQQASKTFTNSHWQAFSAYGNEDYQSAATLYGQFNDKESLLAQANALAHGREYIKARNMYKELIVKYPNYQAPQSNILIVQAIIDEVNLLSESQRSEQGEAIKELGDEPQTGDGAKRKEARTQKLEQLSSEQLLLDENLNSMWLRQVQKDPASFLSQKFYFQHEQKKDNTSKESINDE